MFAELSLAIMFISTGIFKKSAQVNNQNVIIKTDFMQGVKTIGKWQEVYPAVQ